MYEMFFGFREKPFRMTPDPRFLYLSATHKEALAQLIYGVKERKGFVVLSGEVGTGKTTVVRAMLEGLDDNCQFAYVFNTKLSVVDFLRLVCHDFGLQVKGEAKTDYLVSLHDFLIESDNDGKTTTLIVDEAQNLDVAVFEEIRMLTNLETPSHKLLQIFLVGQPELNTLLDQADLQQLKQRVSTRYHLVPLDQKETREYIHFRMRIAGARFMNCFTEGAIQKIYQYSHGIPRLINNICDNALLLGYAKDNPIVSEKTIRECVVDLDLRNGSRTHKRQYPGGAGQAGQRHSLVYAFLL
ncbi:MAG: AAA family ATPase, partial [Deltaproteobacteria bacterium]|nr:AAA family ATPase [Deltaproteobacteria bacterium]